MKKRKIKAPQTLSDCTNNYNSTLFHRMLLLHSHVFVPNSTSAKVRFVSSTLNTGQSLLKIVTDASKALSTKEQKGFFSSLSIAKDCLLTGQDKKSLALGSPGYFFVSLVVIMPKMAQYTGKWVLTSPK